MCSLVHVYKFNELNQLEEQRLVRPSLGTCGSRFVMDVAIRFINSFIGGFVWSTTYNGFILKYSMSLSCKYMYNDDSLNYMGDDSINVIIKQDEIRYTRRVFR